MVVVPAAAAAVAAVAAAAAARKQGDGQSSAPRSPQSQLELEHGGVHSTQSTSDRDRFAVRSRPAKLFTAFRKKKNQNDMKWEDRK
jgi:hypothetical protein